MSDNPTILPSPPNRVNLEIQRSAERMSVIIAMHVPTNFRDAGLNSPLGGTGGVFHTHRADGSTAQYIITNNHLVTDADNNHRPDGVQVNGQYYHVFYDQDRNPGLARLVSFSQQAPADQAILAVLDPVRDRAEVQQVLNRIDPREAARHRAGHPVLTARHSSMPIENIAPLQQDPGLAASQLFQVTGYPIGLEADAEKNREGIIVEGARHQQETIAGAYLHADGTMILVPQNGGDSRKGYSGSVVIDQITGQAVGILHSAGNSIPPEGIPGFSERFPHYNGREIAVASGLMPAAEEIRRIEVLRVAGQHPTVGIATHAREEGFTSETLPFDPARLGLPVIPRYDYTPRAPSAHGLPLDIADPSAPPLSLQLPHMSSQARIR